MIAPSPKREAAATRWMRAILTSRTATALNLLTDGDALPEMGADTAGDWAANNQRTTFAAHSADAEAPGISQLEAEAWRREGCGWGCPLGAPFCPIASARSPNGWTITAGDGSR